MSEAAKTPIYDLLCNIPEDARMIYEHSQTHSQAIPVGRLAMEAREELSTLRRENEELRAMLVRSEGGV